MLVLLALLALIVFLIFFSSSWSRARFTFSLVYLWSDSFDSNNYDFRCSFKSLWWQWPFKKWWSHFNLWSSSRTLLKSWAKDRLTCNWNKMANLILLPRKNRKKVLCGLKWSHQKGLKLNVSCSQKSWYSTYDYYCIHNSHTFTKRSTWIIEYCIWSSQNQSWITFSK